VPIALPRSMLSPPRSHRGVRESGSNYGAGQPMLVALRSLRWKSDSLPSKAVWPRAAFRFIEPLAPPGGEGQPPVLPYISSSPAQTPGTPRRDAAEDAVRGRG